MTVCAIRKAVAARPSRRFAGPCMSITSVILTTGRPEGREPAIPDAADRDCFELALQVGAPDRVEHLAVHRARSVEGDRGPVADEPIERFEVRPVTDSDTADDRERTLIEAYPDPPL